MSIACFPQALSVKEARLIQAAKAAYDAFTSHSRELSDLRPSFWTALGRLVAYARLDAPTMVAEVIANEHRQFGAPGDFGYGTPCGDALRELYDAHNANHCSESESCPDR